MKILKSVKNKKGNQILSVEVEPELFQKLEEKTIDAFIKDVNVKGFRKGKAPKKDAIASLDPNKVRESVFNKLSKEVDVWIQANEKESKIIGNPLKIEIEDFDIEKKITKIKYEYETFPTIELDDYLKIETNDQALAPYEINDTDVEEQIQKELTSNVMLSAKDDIATVEDVILFDFEGFLDDKPLENAKAKNYELDLSNSNFIPGFAEQLLGLKKSDEKTFSIKFPDDYHAETLKGKDVVFKIKVNEVKLKNKPNFDDNFIATLPNYSGEKTVVAYKNFVHQKLVDQKENERKQALEKAVVYWSLMNEKNRLSHMPIKSIQNEFSELYKNKVAEIETQFKTMGGFKEFLKITNSNDEQFRERIFYDTVNSFKLTIVTDEIALKENINVSDEDYELTKKELTKYTNDKLIIEKYALQKKVINFLITKVVYNPDKKFEFSEPKAILSEQETENEQKPEITSTQLDDKLIKND